MNSFTKMYLIPEDEYIRLRAAKQDVLSAIVNNQLPAAIKQSYINKAIDSTNSRLSQRNDPTDSSSHLTSNLRKHEQLLNSLFEKIDRFNSYVKQPSDEQLKSETFKPAGYSTPVDDDDDDLDEKFRFEVPKMTYDDDWPETPETRNRPDKLNLSQLSIFDEQGKLIDSSGNVIPGTNIENMEEFLRTIDKPRGPPGYKHVLRSIAEKGLDVNIKNPRAKSYILNIKKSKTIQIGKGLTKWTSLRKF